MNALSLKVISDWRSAFGWSLFYVGAAIVAYLVLDGWTTRAFGFLSLSVPLTIAVSPSAAKIRRSEATYVAKSIREFLDGSGLPWDWEVFASVRLTCVEARTIRQRASAFRLPLGPDARMSLEELAENAERLAQA